MKKTPPSSVYDREHLAVGVPGYEYFLTGLLPLSHRKALDYLQPNWNEMVLDIGYGRGEIVRECRKLGANAIGIDYSQAAVEISRETVKDGVIIRASATHLPFANETFDKIVLLDILEHLDREDTLKCVMEIRRVLKTNGMVLLHTPSTWEKLLSLPLHLYNFYNAVLGRPVFDPEIKRLQKLTHVNIQSPISLRRLFRREDLDIKIWFDCPSKSEIAYWKFIIYKTLFFAQPLWAIAYRRNPGSKKREDNR